MLREVFPVRMTLLLASALALGALLAPAPAARAQESPLTCEGTATNVVGAHAGSLSIRVGVTIQCDAAASLEVTLPGGSVGTFDTDASGAFTGIAGDAYVCSGHPAPVAVLATDADGGTWTGLLSIESEAGAPADPDGPGPLCDHLLHPGFSYFTYSGPLTTPTEAFASSQFDAVIPFGDVDSTDGADHVMAVFELVPGDTPADWNWIQWRPGAPAVVSTLHLLVPGHTYVALTDAELAWSYPASSAP